MICVLSIALPSLIYRPSSRQVLSIEKSRTSSPRLSRGLVTSLLAHGVWLSLVLGHTSVDGPDVSISDFSLPPHRRRFVKSYWTMSGRIGALKTFGNGWVASLALPSAEMMVTVGRVVILSAVLVCRVSSCKTSNPQTSTKLELRFSKRTVGANFAVVLPGFGRQSPCTTLLAWHFSLLPKILT